MRTIRIGDTGAAVEDVQHRLVTLGFLEERQIDGDFGIKTATAVQAFCDDRALPDTDEVNETVWNELVAATYKLGDRTLYLRMPHFHGSDVLELQQALGALGFFCGNEDNIFGAYTEAALRKFQMNLGLPSDGIAGAYTYNALHNLEHSWVGKGSLSTNRPVGFARAADVLEEHTMCLFGTDEFTRDVASRMSNLAAATTPASKMVSADALSVEPDEEMLLIQVATEPVDDVTPTVMYVDSEALSARLAGALQMAKATKPLRIRVVLPGTSWMEAGHDRTAQHYAITLLDALCQVL